MNVREWALPVYTILMQMAIGSILVLWVLRRLANSKFSPCEMDRIIRNPLLVILVTVIVAIGGSHFHLSKPFLSFYAVRNFQNSWLSREVVFTILFFLIILALWLVSRLKRDYRRSITFLGWLAIVVGIILVYCMARIYMLPTQVAWNTPTVVISFYITTAMLGAIAIACLFVLDLKFAEIQKTENLDTRVQIVKYSMIWLSLVVAIAVVVGIVTLFYQLYSLGQGDHIAQISLQLLFDLYTPLFIARLLCIVSAPFIMGYAVYRMYRTGSAPQELIVPIYISCLLILMGEIIGRFLFYATHIRVGL
jgi:anaerobic dimethyl sulfoxide reductase subunit C